MRLLITMMRIYSTKYHDNNNAQEQPWEITTLYYKHFTVCFDQKNVQKIIMTCLFTL